MSGNKTTVLAQESVYVLPAMRQAMDQVIASGVHHADRAKAILEKLESEIALSMEPTYDELNPPPPVPKEYKLALGDSLYIGTQQYELLSLGEEVTLFDPSFPLFHKTFPRQEFFDLLKECPLNDKYLQQIQSAPVAESDSLDEVELPTIGENLQEEASEKVEAADEDPRSQEEPAPVDSFVDHFYVVADLQKPGTLDISEFDSLDDALNAYRALPSSQMKALGAMNTSKPFPGSLDLLHCKDGVDRTKQAELLDAFGVTVNDQTFIFSTPWGKVYDPRTYEDLFKRTLKRANLPEINFHALRHTFATRALEAGMDIKVLSTILGHAQASTTLNLYAHALPDHKRDSMEKMRGFYTGTADTNTDTDDEDIT